MAQQLDVKKAGERRISRLPPAMVTKSLSQHRAERPTVFRSFSQELDGSRVREEDDTGSSPTIAHPQARHLSHHPRISAMPTLKGHEADEEGFVTPVDRPGTLDTTGHHPPLDYFGLPRTDSPAPTSTLGDLRAAPIQAKAETNLTSPASVSRQQVLPRNNSSNSHLDPTFAISPPTWPVPHQESSDDDYTSSIAGSSFSYPRKLSSSSGISAPHSPLSPFIPVHPPRSPSINSEASANGIPSQRIHLNFSRPRSAASLSILSRADSPASRPPVNSHSRNPSKTIQAIAQIPIETVDADATDNDGQFSGAGSSYTYAKFSLPRGRMVSRDSAIFQGLSTPHFEWKEPLFQNTSPSSVQDDAHLTSPSPLPRLSADPQQDNTHKNESLFAFDFRPTRPTTPQRSVEEEPSTSPSQSFKSARSEKSATSSRGRNSVETGDLRPVRAPAAPRAAADDTKSTSSKSNSTLRPMSTRTGMTNATDYHYMSPDDHLTKGIECHENGSLQESTYHLRVAAMQNHPTAMLLYALACRHGWGMRPNQREGVQWLRKALDFAMLEAAGDEDPSSTTAARDCQGKKAWRAQFALSIYELGVSHLNGWGIEQDKALALRCFEVAGHWGDVDALTEAGFCYAEGIGCKKNLGKAAKFYRMAEQRGVNMVGNSW
jgi:TPR repeat protein